MYKILLVIIISIMYLVPKDQYTKPQCIEVSPFLYFSTRKMELYEVSPFLRVSMICQTDTFASPSRVAPPVRQSWKWQPNMTLRFLAMCTSGLFMGCFSQASCELVAKSTDSILETWFFTDLSHSFLTNKPNIQRKLLKKIQSNLARN